jgi:LCCL domain-containing protein
LIKAMATPSEDLSSMLIGVRNEVMAATGNRQVPWEHSALRARFYFAPLKAANAVPTPSSPPQRQDQAQVKPREPVPAVATAAPSQAVPAVSDCPDDFQAFVGTTGRLACTCSAAATQRGSVYGMDAYAAHSQVCRAALHAGVVGKAGGPVTVIPEAARKAYPGATRNGVSSSNCIASYCISSSKVSFRFADLPAVSDCPDDFQAFAGAMARLACTCSAEATKRGIVYGMDVYAAHSQVCRAALHAGAIGKAGGPVTVIPEAAREAYPGATRNGVTSNNCIASYCISSSKLSFRVAPQ